MYMPENAQEFDSEVQEIGKKIDRTVAKLEVISRYLHLGPNEDQKLEILVHDEILALEQVRVDICDARLNYLRSFKK